MADEPPLNPEQEIVDAVHAVVQRVLNFDTRIVSVSIKVAARFGEPLSIEVELGRKQEH